MDKYLRKYPRTPHLPFSKSIASDDIMGESWAWQSEGLEVVATEKMDGENTTLYNHGFHARSMDGKTHPSRTWAAALSGEVGWQLPPTRRIVCENVYAEHSIRYEELPTFVFGICVIDLLDAAGEPSLEGEPVVLGWDEGVALMEELGITPVPLLYRGPADFKKLEEVYRGLDFQHQEGIVVRTAGRFPEEDFQEHVGKSVRAHHVSTDEHWLRTWKPNSLAK